MKTKYDASEFRDHFGPWAVVAGGSDGIGAAFARDLARRGLSVALIARRPEPLDQLADEIRTEFRVETRAISADLTLGDVVEVVGGATEDIDVGLLVCNAGASLSAGKFLDTSLDSAHDLIKLNCRAPLFLAHHFGTRLQARGRGGIVLMSSMACLAGSPLQVSYAAAKSFVTTLAEGLWHELAGEGVDVLGVLAGATRTETMLAQARDQFEDAMDPREVARGALDHLGKGPNWIPGAANRAAARAIWPTPRVPLINGMAQASAQLFSRSCTSVDGVEFHEE